MLFCRALNFWSCNSIIDDWSLGGGHGRISFFFFFFFLKISQGSDLPPQVLWKIDTITWCIVVNVITNSGNLKQPGRDTITYRNYCYCYYYYYYHYYHYYYFYYYYYYFYCYYYYYYYYYYYCYYYRFDSLCVKRTLGWFASQRLFCFVSFVYLFLVCYEILLWQVARRVHTACLRICSECAPWNRLEPFRSLSKKERP